MPDVDVLVIGGGVIGSSAAYFLKRADAGVSVTVIEPDPLYRWAATPKASGGARRLFTRPENIRMSQFGIAFFKDFHAHVAVDGEAPEIGWKERGYLFIVPPETVPTLERNFAVQEGLGVRVEMLDPAALGSRYPSMYTGDIGAGVLSPEDGWMDPNAALQGFRRKARSLGASYVQDRVVGLAMTNDAQPAGVSLASGRTITATFVINAAGAWSKEICAMLGMPLPVEPMRRFDHYFECAAAIEPLPYVKDLARLALRPEGRGYTAGLVDYAEPRGFNHEMNHSYFERVVWPAIAHRVPAFEEIRQGSSWTGIYDMNEVDGNMILGSWPDRLDRFFVACGFSGHGLMHAPAIGRALSELILHGGYTTLDLSRMDYRRIRDGVPYPELGII